MKKFKYGIMVINPHKPLDDNEFEVVHFVGYWQKPSDVDANHIKEELRNDPEFNLRDIVDDLRMYLATPSCLKYYNDMCEADGVFNDKEIWKEKLN